MDTLKQPAEKKTRINYIDFLKVIGLTGIIIAHVGSPDWLMQLRSFDVPFMVILSSILGELSFRKYEAGSMASAKEYFISRIKRLAIPTWIFLTLYFILDFFLSGGFQSVKYYIFSYCLTRYGINYVWVILIYIYCALLIPLFSRLKLSRVGMLAVGLAYILFEVLYYFGVGTKNAIIDTTFYYIVPYGLLTYLGYNYSKMTKKVRIIIACVSFAVFAALGAYYWHETGTFQLVQVAKYPPRLYYLGYGVFCSFVLLMVCEKYRSGIYDNKAIKYISSHSMWIYLWHILWLRLYEVLKLPEIWFVKLPAVYICAVLTVLAVNKLLDVLDGQGKIKQLKYLRG